MGKGLTSFIVAVLWTVVCIACCTFVPAIPLGFGEPGAWWGIGPGVNSGAVIAYVSVAWYVRRVSMKAGKNDDASGAGTATN